MWIWVQQTGELIAPNGEVVAVGYAGKGPHRNKPASERVVNAGPLPRGVYEVRAPLNHDNVGRYALKLEPMKGTEMYGRSGFWMHGDNAKNPGNASEGCPIVPRAAREAIWLSGCLRLRVVAMREDV